MNAQLIQPDVSFIREVRAAGGSDLKKCFQCATCSVVCDLSPDDAPFPRKQMIAAQWGLKDQLLCDPAIWLCHNCGSCTTQCPRGARPGDVMAALRQLAIRNFAFPGFMGRLVANPKALPVLFLVPALVLLAIILWVPKGPATPELEFANLFPVVAVEALFFTVSTLAAIAFLVGVIRYLKALRMCCPGILLNFPPVSAEIVTHERFAQCNTNQGVRWGHFLVLWGFLGLASVGTTIGIGTMAGILRTPLPWGSALKILANVCAAGVLTGAVILIRERTVNQARRAASTYFDWLFLGTLTAVVFTGILLQFFRLAQVAYLMYPVYFVHLVLTLALLLYAPYSKFAHLAYRTVAMASTEPWKPKRKPRRLSEQGAKHCVDFYS
ncbi:MAG: quinone-interacting membrane-bound oxidoreductase complex subunit QmoC [Bryobacterales bacterium]|nr:quinone-interacting membrane-bound oxidoreductase complex subunit QmoC [Bryobacterales bacterium]